MSQTLQTETGLPTRALCARLALPASTLRRWGQRQRQGRPLLQSPGPKKLHPLPVRELQEQIRGLPHGCRRTRQTGALYQAYGEAISRRDLAVWVSTARAQSQRDQRQELLGNLSLGQRTAEDRKELAALPGRYFSDLKDDFSNIWELTSTANEKFAGRIEVGWDKPFDRAAREFRKEYDRSGESSNTLTALGPILSGYLKSIYHGIVAPSSKTIVKTGATAVTYAGAYGVFLPVSTTAVVAGWTIQSVGLTFYYTGRTGIKLVSPTIESGLLAGMAVLSLSAVPVLCRGRDPGRGEPGRVFTAAGPDAVAAQGATTATVDTATYVGLVAYDGVKGVTKVVINQASSGVVLGYNALTAVPTHLIMGVEDTAVFLAWDGLCLDGLWLRPGQ